ncbi:NUDIX hydrolase [Mycoplasma sp. 394]
MSDVFFELENGDRFKYRVGVIIRKENQILIASDPWNGYWYLPGGKVAMHESIDEAVLREIKEELNINVVNIHKHFLIESFYVNSFNLKRYHELSIIVSAIPVSFEKISKPEFTFEENGNVFAFKWIDIDKLKDINFFPRFLVDQLDNLPQDIKIITIRQ